MLCLMFECPIRGVLADAGGTPWSDQEIAEAIGGPTGTNLECIAELLGKGVASRNDRGAIFSRRLVRDEQARKGNAQRQEKLRANGGGDPDRWAAIRARILERDKHMCAYCGRKADTVDHVVPKSKGGDESDVNLVACCKRCNHQKTARTPWDANMPFWDGFNKNVLSEYVRNNSDITPRSSSSSSSSKLGTNGESDAKELPPIALAQKVAAEVCLQGHGIIAAIGGAIEFLVKHEGKEPNQAVEFLIGKARDEIGRGGAPDRFWFESRKWKKAEAKNGLGRGYVPLPEKT